MGVSTAYYLSSTASDLSGGADFSRKLVTTVEAASTVACSIASSATETSYGFTEPGNPGVCGRAGPRPYTVKINVTSANVNIFGSVNLARVNSAGVVQRAWKAATEQQLNTTGVKTFSFTDVDLGEFGYGDRLRVSYILRNNSGAGAQSVTLGTGTSSEQVAAKWLVNNLAASLMDLDRGKRIALTAFIEGFTDPICTEVPPDDRTKTYAIDFDGSDDNVDCGNSTSLNNLTDWTILIWFKPDDLNTLYGLAGAWHNTGVVGYGIELSTAGKIVTTFTGTGAGGVTLANDASVTAAAWNFAGISVGGVAQTVIRGIINDTDSTVSYTAITQATRNSFTAQTFKIGQRAAGTLARFPGRIGYVAVFNRALTEDEMRRLKYRIMTRAWGNEDSDGLWDDCVAQYDFERGTGTLLTNTKNPGTHDGTLTNGPTWQSDACYSATYRPYLSIDASFGQEIEPLGTRSSISGFTLRVLDTDEWFTNALSDISGHLLKKQVVLHLGCRGLLEGDYQQVLVGEIAGFSLSAGAYTLRVKDALFGSKQKIRLGRTTLQAALNAGVTTNMQVATTDSGGGYFLDAEDMNLHGYVKIDDEVIRYTLDAASSASVFLLQTLTRAQFGTTDATHAIGAVVQEVYHFEAIGAMFALMSLLLSGGGLNASHLHDTDVEVAWKDATTRQVRGRGCGMSPADVATADIDALIAADGSIDNNIDLYITEDVEDVKDLIEREILRAVGAFFYTKYDGRLSVARVKAPSASDVVGALSPREMRLTSWELTQDDIVNMIVVEYDWTPGTEEFAGRYIASDVTSAARYGVRKREYSLRGLTTSTDVGELTTNILARFKIPYITVEAVCSLSEFYYEPGDVVRLTDFNIPNLSTGYRGVFDMLFQIVGKKVDLRRGQISFTLADMSRS